MEYVYIYSKEEGEAESLPSSLCEAAEKLLNTEDWDGEQVSTNTHLFQVVGLSDQPYYYN